MKNKILKTVERGGVKYDFCDYPNDDYAGILVRRAVPGKSFRILLDHGYDENEAIRKCDKLYKKWSN